MKQFCKLVLCGCLGVAYASSSVKLDTKEIVDCSIATSKTTSCFPYPSKIHHIPPREFYKQTIEPLVVAPSVLVEPSIENNRTINPTPKPKIMQPPKGEYKVGKGESIGLIARKFSLTTHQIKQSNPEIQALQEGQTINLPLTQQNIDTISSGQYRVQAGDTLGHIAMQFHVDTRDIIRFNSLKSANSIRIGQVLELPLPHRMSYLEAKEREQNRLRAKQGIPHTSTRQLRVTATAYTSHPEQTQGDPFLGAWNNRLRPGDKTIAVSRDLLTQFGLKNGSKVRISGLSGYYTVRDKMHRRFTKRIDIYMGLDRRRALQWGRRSVVIYW